MTYSDAFYDEYAYGSLISARAVIKELFDRAGVFPSVVDVGCGIAAWAKAALELGANQAVGIDGDHVNRSKVLIKDFRVCDLEAGNLAQPAGGTKFDLTICLEVAEHLSAKRARSFIAELSSLGDLFLFSAAIPHQIGANHINEQWPDYWSALFAEQGCACFDVLRSRIWDRNDCEWWYAQNTLLFARWNTDAFWRASRFGPPVAKPMRLVHPTRFLRHYPHSPFAHPNRKLT